MIPPFDPNHVLPPKIGDGYNRNNYSPYKCDIMEFCQHYSVSQIRKEILKGFVDFRLACIAHDIKGRQWVDGTFVEDTAGAGRSEPVNVRVASLIEVRTQEEADRILQEFPAFVNPILSTEQYRVDHYVFLTNQSPDEIIAWANFWIQLFSHNDLGVWKGILEIPIYNNDSNDQMARSFLNML